MPQRHLEAAQRHDDAAVRHHEAALYWEAHGDRERAALERRHMEIERAAAQLECNEADFIRRRRATRPQQRNEKPSQ
jgi:hypothetical protein